MKQLWYKKYRPKTLDGFVFIDDKIKNKIEEWVAAKDFPHLLLAGSPGTGKSTLAYILTNECGFDDVDVKYIAASVTKGIDTIRDEVITFVERASFGGKGRVVILDEVDETTRSFQTALRNLIGEMYDSARFILTANYPHKIIPALKSRAYTINFSALDKETFVMRLVDILSKENVKFDADTMFGYVEKYYPDMRRTINALEHNTIDGTLTTESENAAEESPDWMKEAVVRFEMKDIKGARQLIVNNISDSLYDDFYTMLYQNLHWFSEDEDVQDAALMIIKNAYVDDKSVANREIVLSACLAQLSRLMRKAQG